MVGTLEQRRSPRHGLTKSSEVWSDAENTTVEEGYMQSPINESSPMLFRLHLLQLASVSQIRAALIFAFLVQEIAYSVAFYHVSFLGRLPSLPSQSSLHSCVAIPVNPADSHAFLQEPFVSFRLRARASRRRLLCVSYGFAACEKRAKERRGDERRGEERQERERERREREIRRETEREDGGREREREDEKY